MDFDVCIIGSGAGASPVAYTLANAGKKVVILEKGPWFKTEDFTKDEIAANHRSVYTPKLRDEQHVIEEANPDGSWMGIPTSASGWNFWNGNMVGGSSNLMSGYFHRLKPRDFRLASEFGPIEGANVADWPIDYDMMEPYYEMVERVVGVSGKVVDHPNLEPRSTKDFPYPPLAENAIAGLIDQACKKLGYHSIPTPRAILSRPDMGRKSCYYSDYCGSYGCSSDAKSSARAALLNHALKTGNCEIRPFSKAFHIKTNPQGKIEAIQYYDEAGKSRQVDAKIYVIACQAIETSRLLLASTGPKYPNGLANNSGQVGKNLIFSGGGIGGGDFHFEDLKDDLAQAIKQRGIFVNRSLQDWYFFDDNKFGGAVKGGTIDFAWRHANPITQADDLKYDAEDKLIWGLPLKRKLENHFKRLRHLEFEVFNDWLPNDNCHVSLDRKTKDKWGNPVARIRIGYHQRDLEVGSFLAGKAEKVLGQMGAKNIRSDISGSPSSNLQAGGCRFGNDPATSVLDKNCRVHEVENLFVTDGSFMPTGGSVPYTWTIYANAFRIADVIRQEV